MALPWVRSVFVGGDVDRLGVFRRTVRPAVGTVPARATMREAFRASARASGAVERKRVRAPAPFGNMQGVRPAQHPARTIGIGKKSFASASAAITANTIGLATAMTLRSARPVARTTCAVRTSSGVNAVKEYTRPERQVAVSAKRTASVRVTTATTRISAAHTRCLGAPVRTAMGKRAPPCRVRRCLSAVR
jgi:hypothetical protein